jgi:hypothetical protein
VATRVLLRRNAGGRARFGRPPRSSTHMRGIVVAPVVLAAMLALVPWAAAGTLDQSQSGISTTTYTAVSDIYPKAQTFTSGLTGALDQVDLAIGRAASSVTATLVVEIRPLSGGVPSGPPLASASIPAANVPVAFGGLPSAFYSIPFASPAPVTAGVQYAIVASALSCGGANCYFSALGPLGDSYPAGSILFSQDFGATWMPYTAFGSADLPFRTYVLQGPPSSKQECKKRGWRKYKNPSFKNQGQCVKFVNHQGGKGGNGKVGKDKGDKGKKKGGKTK